MTTANFTDWAGNLLDIGPIYPLVGLEWLMVIIALVFWVGWHVVQITMENRTHEKDAQLLKQGDNLKKAMNGEHWRTR
jgi:hypothetical protein